MSQFYRIHQVPVLFESNLSVRTYILNRPKKLNALDEPMLNILKPKIEVRACTKFPISRAYLIESDSLGMEQVRALWSNSWDRGWTSVLCGGRCCESVFRTLQWTMELTGADFLQGVVLNAANDSTRHKAIDFFKRE